MSTLINIDTVIIKQCEQREDFFKELKELLMSQAEKLAELKALAAEKTNLYESVRVLVIGLVDKVNELRAAGDEAALDELLSAVREQHSDLGEAVSNGTAAQEAWSADAAPDTVIDDGTVEEVIE